METSQTKAPEEKVCWTCKQPKKDLLRCTRCKNASYCGMQCQKRDWPSHKLSCSKTSVPPLPKEQDMSGMNEFYQVKQIGTGNFSTIYRVRSKKDEKLYAVKQAEKGKLQRTGKTADLFMQKHCLTKLKDCEYAVKLYKTFQDEVNLYLQMEYPQKGELWQFSKHFGVSSESMYKYYVCQLLKAYEIVHRDLKPENVLLDADHKLKLIDFGTAKDLSRPDIKGAGNGLKGRKPFQHYVGTPHYMAPQCIHNKASEKISDVYSLSGVLYFLKVGTPPFVAGSQYLIFTKSLKTELCLPSELFSDALVDLILNMNKKQMKDRLPLQKVMQHQYFQGVNFDKLSTYEEALAQQSALEKKLTALSSDFTNKYSTVYKQSVQKRQKIYHEQIVPYLQSKVKEQTEDVAKFSQRIEIIKLQTQLLINLSDDQNLGFSQLYKKFKGIAQTKIELNEQDVSPETKLTKETEQLKLEQPEKSE